MISSQDEAISLLSKWKADRKAIMLVVSDGPPDDPAVFLLSVTGVVKDLTTSWVEVSSGTNICRLRLDLPGTCFSYIESRDPRLHMDDSDREDAERLFEGCLSLNFINETFCVFNVLREEMGIDEE
jgi:hypothetical protein